MNSKGKRNDKITKGAVYIEDGMVLEKYSRVHFRRAAVEKQLVTSKQMSFRQEGLRALSCLAISPINFRYRNACIDCLIGESALMLAKMTLS